MVNPLMNHLAFNAIINLAIWPLKPKMYDEDIGTNVFILSYMYQTCKNT